MLIRCFCQCLAGWSNLDWNLSALTQYITLSRESFESECEGVNSKNEASTLASNSNLILIIPLAQSACQSFWTPIILCYRSESKFVSCSTTLVLSDQFDQVLNDQNETIVKIPQTHAQLSNWSAKRFRLTRYQLIMSKRFTFRGKRRSFLDMRSLIDQCQTHTRFENSARLRFLFFVVGFILQVYKGKIKTVKGLHF